MSMHNLLEYSDNFSMTSKMLRGYYRDEVNESADETDNNDNLRNNIKTTKSKSLKYKAKIIGSTSNDNNILDAEVDVPLKYLSYF